MDVYYLTVFFLLVTPPCLCDDWTSSCPSNCTCKWTNGKKSAICNSLEITSVPTTLSTEIQVLYLNENLITYINREEFTSLGLVNLQRIFIKKSKVKYIHRDAFKNLKILIEIDLSENDIESIEKETFAGNDRLRILILYGNPIKNLVAYQFPILPHLRSLDLHDCQINFIDGTAFKNLAFLELLNLKTNLLENLSEHVFDHMENLKTLTLEENPWNCDCKLRKFRNWYLKSNLHGVSLTCKRPYGFKDQQWETIDENQFGCSPKVELFSDSVQNEDIGTNVSFHCLVYGDPQPEITWDVNGKILDNDNILNEVEHSADQTWSNLTIFNITSYDSGIYTCSARNIVGFTSKNATLFLPEVVEHVIVKTPETFWYFGLILGTFGTVFGLILISVAICICRKAARKRKSRKNIKGSVSFNDQEKKLLDLSITTNERQDSCEMANTPSTNKTTAESVIALEPVQITIENISRNNDEFPLNVGVFPPPPEFCSNVLPNPAYGNIFISVSVTQDALDNPDLNMYPDLLNIPNRVKGKFVPINVASYATLPRNNRLTGNSSLTKKDIATIHENDVVNYHNLETNNYVMAGETSSNNINSNMSGCVSCRKNQNVIQHSAHQHHHNHNQQLQLSSSSAVQQQSSQYTTMIDDNLIKCSESFLCPKYDNMGRRITASGNSTLSLPDEEQLENEMLYGNNKEIKEIPTPPLPPTCTSPPSNANDFVSL